ncbi:MAG: hypothetical protein JWP00_1725 [Chloroflexi bacterium]|nr:hypothetical protein [Chloroflexota bacterium]
MNINIKLIRIGLASLMLLLNIITMFDNRVTVQAAIPAATIVNNPPSQNLNITVFPQRDFVSATGYLASDIVQVSLIHPSGVSYSTNNIVPQDAPGAPAGAAFAGIVEVNHPGAACWPTVTPDIRAGDKLRITIVENLDFPGRVGQADETTLRNVTAGRPVETAPGTIQVHGTAVEADGVTPLPASQLEQRMVANQDAFLLNGRRTIRANTATGSDGTLTYDAPSSINWTATYSNLDPADVTRALNAESRGLWVPAVVAPALPTESTIYENGAGIIGGPAGPACTAPLEKLPPPPGSETVLPTTPTGLTANVVNGNTVNLNWTASTDNVGVVDYGIYRDGIAVATVQNPDASAPAPTSFTDKNVAPGTYTYTVDAGDAVGNRSALSDPVSNITTVRPAAALPPGTVVNEPPAAPIQIISFPARDFISSSGFEETDSVVIQLLRKEGGQLVLVSSATQTPQADPRAAANAPFAGIVEVNHPGGACWDGITPDIRAGDIVRMIAYNPNGSIRTVNQTTTSNAVSQKPVIVTPATGNNADGVIEVHGIAMDANGNPIDLAQIEQRMVANRDAFDLNGRRAIRAGGAGKDGTLVYDTANNPTGVKWTATYTGLTADDIYRAIGGKSPSSGRVFGGAEARVLWLGLTPLNAREITIYENDGGGAVLNGPAGPVCTAAAEPLDTAPPVFPAPDAGLVAKSVPGAAPGTNDVQLTWTAASDNVEVYGYGIYRDGMLLRNLGGGTTSYIDKNVVGNHNYTVDATDSASPGPGGNAQGTPYGNRSAQSTPPANLSVTDVVPPSVPANLTAKASGASVTLKWSASTDNVGVTGYTVYRSGSGVTGSGVETIVDAQTLTFTDTNVVDGTTYKYSVDAFDAARNHSAQTAEVSTTIASDTVAPSVPANLAANLPDIHGKSIQLTWTAATDNVGVTGYGLYRRNIYPALGAFVKIADLNGLMLSYTDPNLATGTYEYVVDAVDSAGNQSAQSTIAGAAVANDPPVAPHSLIAFPARDFISATGYPSIDGPYTFTLLRDGKEKYKSTPFNSDANGLVEVNHPGGTCWNVNTPDIRAGDIIRITSAKGIPEQTTVSNIASQRPIAINANTVQVHGSAQDANGQPLPLDQVENRLISNRDPFKLNGRRTLRAGGGSLDGVISYDSPGSSSWTATYTGLNGEDVARAAGGTAPNGVSFIGAESRGVWLGRNPVALTEMTTFENGAGVAGGPSAPCTAPGETPVAAATLTPNTLAFGNQAYIPPSTSAAKQVTFSNGGSGPMTIGAIYLAGLQPGDYAISDNTCPATLGAGLSCTVSVTFTPKALGLREANLSFLDNAANTTDQTVLLSGSGVDVSAPGAPGAPAQTLANTTYLGVKSGPALANSTLPVTLKWASSTGTVTEYKIQQSINGGPFASVTIPAGNVADATLDLPMGTTAAPKTYQFQVQACNNANCSAWVAGPRFTITPVDEGNNSLLSYGGNWSAAQAFAGAYGDTVRNASTSKDKIQLVKKITFTVTGSIAWITTKGPDRGIVSISVDGGPAQTVDLYAATSQPAALAFVANNLAAGSQHTVTVQLLGTKNSKSSSTRVDSDAFVIIS